MSGGCRAGQSELQTLLDFVREGDELCVVKLDRLGRQTSGILAIVDELRAKKASLRVLQPPLSTDDPVTGQMMIAMRIPTMPPCYSEIMPPVIPI